jgi:hypothetical protein
MVMNFLLYWMKNLLKNAINASVSCKETENGAADIDHQE